MIRKKADQAGEHKCIRDGIGEVEMHKICESVDELYGKGVAESRTDAMRAAQDRAKQEKVKEEETRVSEDGKTAYKTAYAEDRDNFIIVGKGWGHGVGMSQWGAYELGLKGYTAKEILDAYFTDIDIMDYLDTNQY